MSTNDSAAPDMTTRRQRIWAIFVISLAGLVLEVAYTRVVSYKLWYYYVYLVIGLALLGIGSGATAVVLSKRLRGAPTQTVLRRGSYLGAASILVGYLVIARLPIDTVALWSYGTGASFKAIAVLLVICFTLFATFLSVGVMVSTLLGRGGEDVSRLYFADLVGAGLGCAMVVYLVVLVGPPGAIALSAALLAANGVVFTPRAPAALRPLGAAFAVVLLVLGVVKGALPDVRPEATKVQRPKEGWEYSAWGPVFRVDVGPVFGRADAKWLIHDATYGSAIHQFDGNPKSQTRFNDDPRKWPFDVLGTPPDRQLIIGSAGGNEILASLYRGSKQIDAVELNPVTVGIVKDRFKSYTGDLTSFDQVHLTNGDGRTYLARTDKKYDLVWFVAPDSYAANNAASSGAFVLSESYLYTADMLTETLRHLSDRGVGVAQFGEFDFANKPNRTARYLLTAREAFRRIGVKDPSRHILVATSEDPLSSGLSTIMLKRTPFTAEEVRRFRTTVPATKLGRPVYAPGDPAGTTLVTKLPTATESEVDSLRRAYRYEVGAITDDRPFFWHFAGFDDVVRKIRQPINPNDREDSVGERVLLLLLAIASVFAVAFLLLPFVVVKEQWKALPAKGPSAVYFAALGLGFMLFEITMIQRLSLYLGYPTYSLTVTLASILIFTGVGSLVSGRFTASASKVLVRVLGLLVVLAVLYRLALAPLTDATLGAPFVLRVLVAFLLLAPLGICLGMFMPLGLRTVAGLSEHADEYVAWGWAINGAFSVIGSVLTTILAMSYGFRNVQLIALVLYGLAALAFTRIRRNGARSDDVTGAPVDDLDHEELTPAGSAGTA